MDGGTGALLGERPRSTPIEGISGVCEGARLTTDCICLPEHLLLFQRWVGTWSRFVNFSTWEIEAGGSGVQDQLLP